MENTKTITTLRGITWDHSRAFPPLVAVSQRYEELNPGIRIRWEKRTLDEFGHKPIDQLISDYDLIVIDHPWAGFCFERDLVADLKPLLSASQWVDLEKNGVGQSFNSYVYEGKLLAIPIDAATPVASRRSDLMEERGLRVPETWEDLIVLADQKQAVMPAFRADLFLNWLMLLYALDARPFQNTEKIALHTEGVEAMSMLRRLAEAMPEEIYKWNPIMIAEEMTRNDSFAYCAFAYSYGNYCRPSFTDKPLKYGDLVSWRGRRLRSILGGTGISVSSRCADPEAALDFSLYCGSASVQSNIYTYSGGQAVREEAWQSENLLEFTGGFYRDSHRTTREALVRPRYSGYVPLQEKAGEVLQEYVRGNMSPGDAWKMINHHYRDSLPKTV